MSKNKIVKDSYFSITLTLLLILTYPYLKIDGLTSGCKNKFYDTLVNKFHHANISHLCLDIVNILFLYERGILTNTKGVIIFFVSLFLVTMFETLLSNIFPTIICSSGLFSVFIAIGAFDTLKSVQNTYIISGLFIIGSVISNIIQEQNFTYLGYFIGVFVGLLLCLTC